MSIIENKKGQSLVEAIGAIAVILVGIVTTVAMFIYGINALTIASLKSQAHYLAIEQIEAARWLRDSNWLHDEAGTTPSYDFQYVTDNDYGFLVTRPDNADPNEYYRFYYSSNSNANCTPADPDHPCKQVAKTGNKFYQNFYGSYSIYSPAPEPTVFNRWVEFSRICEGDLILTSGADCNSQYPGTEQIGTQAKSMVQFQKGTQNIEYFLEERLYDWKY